MPIPSSDLVTVPREVADRVLDHLYNPFESDNQSRAYLDFKNALSPVQSDVGRTTKEDVQRSIADGQQCNEHQPHTLRLTLDYVRLGVKAGQLMAAADCGNHSEGCMEDAMTGAGLSKLDRKMLDAECNAADAIRKQITSTCEDSALGYAAYMLPEEDQAALAVLGVTSDWLYRKSTGEPSRKELLDPVKPRAVAETDANAPGDTGLVSGVSSAPNHQPRAVSQGWQDIETAPRDGTPFLCFHPDDVFSPITGIDLIWWEPSIGRWTMDGDNKVPFVGEITHWMPLPAPPSPRLTDGDQTSSLEER